MTRVIQVIIKVIDKGEAIVYGVSMNGRGPLWSAARKAMLRNGTQYKIGAACTYNNRVYSAHNQVKTHPLQKRFSSHDERWRIELREAPLLHAEIALLAKVRAKIDEVFIYREGKNGRLALARPCAGCMMALKAFGVKVVHYTVSNGYKTEHI